MLAFVLVGAGALPARAQGGSGSDLTRSAAADAPINDTLRWDTKEKKAYKITTRITPNMGVSLRLTHFNFLRYEPTFTTEVKQIQGYAELAQLWTQFLTATPASLATSSTLLQRNQPTFIDALNAWRRGINKATDVLGGNLAAVPLAVGLSDDDVKKIVEMRDSELKEPKSLEDQRLMVEGLLLAFTSTVEAWYAQELYDAELKRHDAVIGRINLFIKRAGEVESGRLKQFDSQKQGTIVTTSIAVTPFTSSADEAERAAREQITTVSYYVQSKLPLVFHAGPAYTNIADVDITKVERPAVGDVFQEVTKPKSEADLIIFMTYMLTPIAYDTPGLGLTIGTGLKDIGTRIYLGATAKFNERLLLSGGAFSQTTTEGDVAFSADPKLFTTVKKVKKWGYFVSVSVSPF